MRDEVQRLRDALHGFVGFVRGGYAQGVLGSYMETLQILTREAEEALSSKPRSSDPQKGASGSSAGNQRHQNDLESLAPTQEQLRGELGQGRPLELINEIENHCPCGARPESPQTHPHAPGCPVFELKRYLVAGNENSGVVGPLCADRQTTNAAVPAEREPQHTDDVYAQGFADAMKLKLAEKRGQGYGGWDKPTECSVEHLAELFLKHLKKPDMVDLGNFAMMLHFRIGGGDALVKAFADRLAASRVSAGKPTLNEFADTHDMGKAQPVAEPLPSRVSGREYKHWPWCNAGRDRPAGEPGTICRCFNSKAADMAAPPVDASGLRNASNDCAYELHWSCHEGAMVDCPNKHCKAALAANASAPGGADVQR